MNALLEKKLERAFFISPIVNMEKLITDIMLRSDVTEGELQGRLKLLPEKHYHGSTCAMSGKILSSGILLAYKTKSH